MSKAITFNLEDELLDGLMESAKNNYRNRGAEINAAISYYLKSQEVVLVEAKVEDEKKVITSAKVKDNKGLL